MTKTSVKGIPADKVFTNLLRDIVPEWPTADVTICVADLVDMFEGENHSVMSNCFVEWIRRIGGKQNLDSYLETLKAGIVQKDGE